MVDLENYCKSLFKKIKNSKDEYIEKSKTKDLHKCRVEVKKLKALVHFIAFYVPGLNEDFSTRVKNVFGKTGKIRDLHVLKSYISSLETENKDLAKELKSILNSREKKAIKTFIKRNNKENKDETDLIEKELLETVSQLKEVDFTAYFNFIVKKILQKISHRKLRDKGYHSLRMDIKELKYNLKLLDSQDTSQLKNVPLEEKLTALEEVLGEWHDKVVLEANLVRLNNKIDDRPLRKEIRSIISLVKSQRSDFLVKVQEDLIDARILFDAKAT